MPPATLLWAKSADRCAGGSDTGYPLPQHLLDVTAVALEMQQSWHGPDGVDANWAALLVGCHDLGKASPGFQRLLGRNHVPGFDLPVGPDRHDAMTVPILTHLLRDRCGVPRRHARQISDAVGAHHGNIVASTEVMDAGRWSSNCTPVWRAAHTELFDVLLGATGVEPELQPLNPGQLRWLMGLTTVADWIGSSDALCRADRVGDAFDPVTWFVESRRLAIKTLQQLQIIGSGLRAVSSGLEAVSIALGGFSPRPLQQRVADVIDDLGTDSGLVVIEAPMGEGKTEAGFALALRPGRGVYMAMPTQSTANALLGRVSTFIARARSDQAPTAMTLAHGAGGPFATDVRLREVGLGTADSGVVAGWWMRGSKRALLAPHGIGTVDQALIGVLNTRHAHVRLAGLAGRTVIVDELHAYDSYTGGLVEALCRWLQVLGCRVVVMSATLPAARRNALLSEWAGADVPVPAATYPRVTWATDGRIQVAGFPASRCQRVEVAGIDPDLVVAEAVSMANRGARVLLVVNKVKRAQEIFGSVRAAGVNSTLFHARFPMDERLAIERGVLEQFGPGGSCTSGHVLVATQVAEQSLDIDMDVLITDIAPVDSVLQRQGRIHRHERGRPTGFETPRVLVAGLLEPLPTPQLTSYIYDQWTVLRSAAWLQTYQVLELPIDIDNAVQDVYGRQPLETTDTMAAAINQAWPEHQAAEAQMVELARQAGLADPADWQTATAAAPIDDDAAETGGAVFGTRLGTNSQSIVPVTQEQLDNLTAHADFLAGHYLGISHTSLMRAVRLEPWPAGWKSQPGLRHHRPLVINAEGTADCGGAMLHPELGLIIG